MAPLRGSVGPRCLVIEPVQIVQVDVEVIVFFCRRPLQPLGGGRVTIFPDRIGNRSGAYAAVCRLVRVGPIIVADDTASSRGVPATILAEPCLEN